MHVHSGYRTGTLSVCIAFTFLVPKLPEDLLCYAEVEDDVINDSSTSQEDVLAEEVTLELKGATGGKVVGRLAAAHLSDHPHASEALAGACTRFLLRTPET